MENQFKYLDYIVQNSDYYQKKGSSAHSEFEAPALNNNWSINKDDNFWTMCFVPSSTMIEQGFKIHISTKYEHANETLCLVSKFLSELNIAFKYVKSQEALYSMYSKNGSRISAGKFITIYPNEQEFIPLLHQLEKVLDGQPKGPYILTDKRWKNTNIYYRYGGFQTLNNQAGDYCIKDPNGGLIPDKREAKFQLPNFIELPKELKEQDELSIVNNEREPSKLNLFTIEKVIRFSNAGGIYQAVRKSDNKKCIIKEARSEIGLDGQGKNAMHRLEAEYNALSQLRNVKGIMQVIDYFQVWEHKFLVVEFIDGNSLYSWVSLNYPFLHKSDVKEYCEKVKKVIELLKCIVEQMHEKGIAMCDLQHQNIIIDDDLNITIIDFETSEDAYAESQPSMATRGFSNLKNTIAKDRDWYSLNRILHFLLLPIGPSYDLDIYNNIKYCLWIRNTFGEEMYKYYHNFQMNTGKNILILTIYF